MSSQHRHGVQEMDSMVPCNPLCKAKTQQCEKSVCSSWVCEANNFHGVRNTQRLPSKT